MITKSYIIPAMYASLVYVPMCKTRANFTLLHVNKRSNVLMVCQLFNFACQRVYLFFKRIFQFLNFSMISTFENFKNICAILENLSHETKNSNFDICKISFLKNLVNQQPLTSFSVEHVPLTNHSASVKGS